MKKLLALVLSMLLAASCFALVAVATEETTAAEGEETTAAEGEATAYSNTLLTFNEDAKLWKILSNPTGINKTYYKPEWEGARLRLTDIGDPFVTINWSTYISKAGLEKVDSQEYPYVVIKLKIDGYVDDFELFYCAGEVTAATPGVSTNTDYPCDASGEIEYIIYDLTGDCEGVYNQFRFDPVGAEEDTMIYLYEVALFATEDEAIAYAGLDQEETEETTVEESEETTAEETEKESTKKPSATKPVEEEKGCGSIISIGAVVAIVALGAVCIKKKD